jgi:hypothetical protein
MAFYKTYKGKFTPKHPEKYIGNVNNIVFRSLWEKSFLTYLDTNINVIRYSSEEIIIPYLNPIDKKVHRYFPDMYVELKDREGNINIKLIEIKPYKQTQKPVPGKRKTRSYYEEELTYIINQTKWEFARKFCEQKNWEFKVLTEKELFGK